MRVILLILFVAVVTAAPFREDNMGDAMQMIRNGVPEVEALEISDMVDVSMHEYPNGEVIAAANFLHPYTSFGVIEAAAAATAYADPENHVVPESVVLPVPVYPQVIAPNATDPKPVVSPSSGLPEIVVPAPCSPAVPEVIAREPVVLPSPAVPGVIPESVALPSSALPEAEFPDVAEALPVPSPQYSGGEFYNDGNVQFQYNGPSGPGSSSEEPGLIATLKSWFNMAIHYFNDDLAPAAKQMM